MESQAFREKSYWLSTRDYVPGLPLSEDLSVDVAIVGGGFFVSTSDLDHILRP